MNCTEIFAGTLKDLPPELLDGLARYRHQVFVEKLGWNLVCQGGLDGQELDQFDRPDTVYLIARSDAGHIVGTARLLPTSSPYLLADVFPELMSGVPLPRSDRVWELSRFAAVDFQAIGASPLQQFSSPVAIELLREVLRWAAAEGIERLISVSPLGVERLLRSAGFRAHRAAPPMVIDGQPIFACWFEVSGHQGDEAQSASPQPARE